MKKTILVFSFLLMAQSFAQDPFCKGTRCSEFDQYAAQIKETYLKMQKLNENCQKSDGKSCAEVAQLVTDTETTIRPEFKEENKKLLSRLGIADDAKTYHQKACKLKVQASCSKTK